MKVRMLMAVGVAAVIGLTSCNSEDAKLAGELVGTWKGSATEMTKDRKDRPDKGDKEHHDGDRKGRGQQDMNRPDHRIGPETMTCTPTFTFVRTEGTNGGTIDISADYTIIKGVESIAVTSPVNATVNGNVKASGTWTVKDGDEVLLTLDPAKTVVNVDTASVALSYARLTDAPQDSLAAIKARVVPNVENVIKPMLTAKIQKMRKLDDVKIVGSTMTLEAGHAKITFTKQ